MKYTHLVIAIPHSSGHPHTAIGASWEDNPEVTKERDRWTDWFTDELFDSKGGGIHVVKCYGSRFDCDVERLEHEPDRICRHSMIDAIEKVFTDAGYRVARNRPYGNSIAPFGYVGHSVMIEVSKRCYMDETTLAKNQGYPRLAATIRERYLRLLGRSSLDEAKSHLFKEDVDYLKARYFIPVQFGGVHNFRKS